MKNLSRAQQGTINQAVAELKAARENLKPTEAYQKILDKQAEREKVAKSKVISIDGRKYFSPDQLKRIVDKASELGYSTCTCWSEMTVCASCWMIWLLQSQWEDYQSDQVKEAITEGTKLTTMTQMEMLLSQKEMDELISYAKQKGIGVTQRLVSLYHMDALLVAMEKLGIQNPQAYFDNLSKTTMDLEEMKRQKPSPRPWLASTWLLCRKSRFHYGTDDMPTTRPMLRLVLSEILQSLWQVCRICQQCLLLWLKSEAFSQWPSTMASTYEDKDELSLTRMSWFLLVWHGVITRIASVSKVLRAINSSIPMGTGTIS